jgi:hypothetical protein
MDVSRGKREVDEKGRGRRGGRRCASVQGLHYTHKRGRGEWVENRTLEWTL